MSETTKNNPLGTERVGSLMVKFAVPSIIAMLVGALYNIVDQLFIGQAVGNAWKRGDQYRVSAFHILYRVSAVIRDRWCVQF